MVPTLSAMPTSVSDQPWLTSQTDTNGPNPVCIAATKKFSAWIGLRPARSASSSAGGTENGIKRPPPYASTRRDGDHRRGSITEGHQMAQSLFVVLDETE